MDRRARSAVERIIERRAEQSENNHRPLVASSARGRARSPADAAKPKISLSEKAARAAEDLERKRVQRIKRRAKDEKQAAARREAMNRIKRIVIAYEAMKKEQAEKEA
ncbi:hypothetical protein Q7P36_001340 [Cladosporium allicinum]